MAPAKYLVLLFVVVLVALSFPVFQKAPLPMENPRPEPEDVSISISPAKVFQGDPALIVVNNLGSTSTIKSLTFDGKEISVFNYVNKPSVLVGIDLRGRVGPHPIVVTLSDGRSIKKDLIVGERTIVQVPMGIPEELGGNTPEAEQELLNTLVQEAKIISAIPVSREKLWSSAFRLPLSGGAVITDTYGYSRLTGASTTAHKGTDFRASIGTPVYAINSGVVRFTRNMRNYGNAIAIDHGTGVLSIYMHLSAIDVELGQEVEKGELIGKSGNTGYVLGPHLHLTIRINGISIDPIKFVELLGQETTKR